MLSQDQKFLFQFVAERAEGEPVMVRIKLFRGLAHSASDKRVSQDFRLRAHQLESSSNDANSRQLKFAAIPSTAERPSSVALAKEESPQLNLKFNQ